MRVSVWPYRLTVRTPAFQAVNRGSIPRRVTNSGLYYILPMNKFRWAIVIIVLAAAGVGIYYFAENKNSAPQNTATHTSSTSSEYALMGAETWDAFKCSTWASALNNKEESKRLYDFGYDQGLRFLDALQAGEIEEADISRVVPMGVTQALQGPKEENALGRIYDSAKKQALDEISGSIDVDSPTQRYQDVSCETLGK